LTSYLKILQDYWGYASFREPQEQIIKAVLNKKDTLALLPTGGGKSICYQVPGILLEGVCLVITPLIALMEDQVKQLKSRGINAIALHSNLSKREIDIALDNVIYGGIKFLYVSPERLKTEIFRVRFQKMKVNLIAVDEAHCIAEWGYDFRPAYLDISKIRELQPETPILALTATATADVIDDVQNKLNFKQHHVIQKSFNRSNLSYYIHESANKRQDLYRILKKNVGSGIIYCNTRKKVKDIYLFLHEKGEAVGFYHGGMDYRDRKQQQESWTNSITRIIVATNAFGMGIDKSDVRFVVHMDLPESIEAYYQEVGRSGRDLKPAFGVLLYNQQDIVEVHEKLAQRYPPLQQIKSIYNAIGNHLQVAYGSGMDERYEIDIATFSNKYNQNLFSVYSALKFLEQCDFILLSENFRQPSKIKILVNNAALYNYQVKDAKINQLILFILRTSMGVFENHLTIDEQKIAEKLKLSQAQVTSALDFLHKEEVIDYIKRTKNPTITYLTERLSEDYLRISPVFYANRKEVAEKKINAILELILTTACKTNYILRYFGEQPTENCHKCSSCISTEKLNTRSLSNALKDYLKTTPKSEYNIDDVIIALKAYDKNEVIEHLRWLADHNSIHINHLGKAFKLNY
jgi:ATP-dependent DNA helicase RecQ